MKRSNMFRQRRTCLGHWQMHWYNVPNCANQYFSFPVANEWFANNEQRDYEIKKIVRYIGDSFPSASFFLFVTKAIDACNWKMKPYTCSHLLIQLHNTSSDLSVMSQNLFDMVDTRLQRIWRKNTKNPTRNPLLNEVS